VKTELYNGVGHHHASPSTPVFSFTTTTKPTSSNNDNPRNNSIIYSGVRHPASRRHQNTALHSSTALEGLPKSVLNFKQNYLPRLGKGVYPRTVALDYTVLNEPSGLDEEVDNLADKPLV